MVLRDAPPAARRQARVILGENYPQPMAEHAAAREQALDAYDTIKKRIE